MTQLADGAKKRRAFAARSGIFLLNLLMPGLGLIRLGELRKGFAFMLAQFAAVGLLILFYAVGPTLDFRGFFIVTCFVVVCISALYLWSIGVSWRLSRFISMASSRLSRWYWILFIWLVVSTISVQEAQLARNYYHPFYSPSEAMAPTLEVDDRFLGHMTDLGQIERGNVVVVRNGTVEYVKRIAGVPGDRISMERGVVLLNGLRVEQSRRETASAIPSTGGSGSVVLDERFPDERRSHQILDVGVTPQDDWPEVTLGAGQYVVLGDNRDNSLDSRFPSEAGGLGIVARDQIVGSVLFRYWRKGVGFAEGQL